MTHGSQYVTNSNNLKMVVGYKVLHLVNNKDMYKTQRCKDAVASFRENNALSHFLHYIIAFKISLIYACLGL